ncbi:hypothetical protein PACTADRAFT_34446 [Pachysolen tannophilus NRRL Y-2460]|uniref:Uncharacterized protein n=1 Tax=Pachysolen tannophilus NRRL Y-2460 TaxID=669874 RepID=A0A1E4TSH3_PACTA|nr:hypothetical protein PACTADRAFT_34446 [Pachysolen tannophilus NRRL Y-2460]
MYLPNLAPKDVNHLWLNSDDNGGFLQEESNHGNRHYHNHRATSINEFQQQSAFFAPPLSSYSAEFPGAVDISKVESRSNGGKFGGNGNNSNNLSSLIYSKKIDISLLYKVFANANYLDDLSSLGYDYLRPIGVDKTMQQLSEEQEELEEQRRLKEIEARDTNSNLVLINEEDISDNSSGLSMDRGDIDLASGGTENILNEHQRNRHSNNNNNNNNNNVNDIATASTDSGRFDSDPEMHLRDVQQQEREDLAEAFGDSFDDEDDDEYHQGNDQYEFHGHRLQNNRHEHQHHGKHNTNINNISNAQDEDDEEDDDEDDDDRDFMDEEEYQDDHSIDSEIILNPGQQNTIGLLRRSKTTRTNNSGLTTATAASTTMAANTISTSPTTVSSGSSLPSLPSTNHNDLRYYKNFSSPIVISGGSHLRNEVRFSSSPSNNENESDFDMVIDDD